MYIAKLTISYDRGTDRNNEKDIFSVAEKANVKPGDTTTDGKIIRGLGTHFRNAVAREATKLRDREAARVRGEFRKKFVVTSLDGVFMVPAPGVAKAFVRSLMVSPGVEVRVSEFILETASGLDINELAQWSEKIKKQLSEVSLGRSEQADEEGLRALEALAACPVIAKATANRIREMVEMVREQKITRIEVKRRIENMTVEIDAAPLAPRRAPVIA